MQPPNSCYLKRQLANATLVLAPNDTSPQKGLVGFWCKYNPLPVYSEQKILEPLSSFIICQGGCMHLDTKMLLCNIKLFVNCPLHVCEFKINQTMYGRIL